MNSANTLRETLIPKMNHDDNISSLLNSSSLNNNDLGQQSSKPFKMNTYIQLDIDQNNFNCLPRICKFLITRLKLDQELHQSSVILAVKLEASKRSLRTLEIPLVDQQKADLNLLYNITYPHYLKKDTNLLYIYVQTRRKKYKTKSKTIQFGYKTLAYTFIDLANALQKPYSNDLPLFLRSTKNGAKQQIIGYLSIQSLTSQPINDYDTTEDIEFDINSEIDSDNEQKNKPIIKNNKNQLTGKIISFIRKLKNENTNQHKSVQSNAIENDNENSLIINDVYDLDYDENEDLDDEFYKNIEQVSDYANSDSDEPNFLFKDQDAYSIVSTPKPKIEPFYNQNFVDLTDEQCLTLNIKRNYLLVENAEYLMDNYVIRKNFTIIDLDDLGKNLSENQLDYLAKGQSLVKIFLIASTGAMLTNYLKNFYLNLVKLNAEYAKIFQTFFIQSNDRMQILNYLIESIDESNYKDMMSQVQIGEVMLHCENEDCKFVPFLNYVSVNQNDDETSNQKVNSLSTSSSLPQFLNLNATNTQQLNKMYKYSPPSSPMTANQDESGLFNLQIDFWTSANNSSGLSEHGQEQEGNETQMITINNKSTLKALFKNITIYKNTDLNQYLSISYCIKEKKQKIMRLSKKSKDIENKKETVDGLTRIVCTSKNHAIPINVWIDDSEYTNIKFLQVSSQWQGKSVYINLIRSNNIN